MSLAYRTLTLPVLAAALAACTTVGPHANPFLKCNEKRARPASMTNASGLRATSAK